MKTRPRRILHVKRDKLTNLVRQLEGMGRTGITDAGGLAKIAMKNDVPLKDLERYIRADGTLSESGKHLLNPKPQKAVYQSRQSPARKKTDIHASTEQENHIIEPHKGILKLITRHGTVSSEITLKGNIEGATHPLIYNLEQDVFYPAVRYANKAWIRGSDTPYIANENSEELTVLPESQRDRVVSHRQRTASLKALGNELDLVRLANRQAENPPRTAIPHKISSIWVGTNTIPLHLMTNLARNARIAMSGRYPFEFTLYLSRQNPKAFTHNHSILSHIAPGIKMLTLEDTVFYEKFKQSKYYEQYHAAIDGNGGVATNFASAADVVRFPLMEEEGGIYMDVDDALVAAPSSIPLETTPEGFILHPPMDNEKLGMSYQYPTSVFGTHKNNPTLGKISEEIYNRYQENKDIYLSRPPHGNTQEFDTYAKRISYLSGPTMFDSVIGKECQGEKQILEAQRLMRYPLDKIENDPLHQMMSTLYENDITQLDDIAQVGSENSWVHSRK